MKRRTLLQASLGLATLWPARRLLADLPASALPDIPATTLLGTTTSLRGGDLRDLAAGLRGELLLSDQSGYEAARRVWNGMIDKRPALIARCSTAADAMRVVDFARAHHLLTAVRACGQRRPEPFGPADPRFGLSRTACRISWTCWRRAAKCARPLCRIRSHRSNISVCELRQRAQFAR